MKKELLRRTFIFLDKTNNVKCHLKENPEDIFQLILTSARREFPAFIIKRSQFKQLYYNFYSTLLIDSNTFRKRRCLLKFREIRIKGIKYKLSEIKGSSWLLATNLKNPEKTKTIKPREFFLVLKGNASKRNKYPRFSRRSR